MNEDMKVAWLEISRMLGEPTREEMDVFLRTWQRAVQATRKALAEQSAQQPAQQEPYCYTYTENGEEYFAPPTAYVPDNATPLYTSPPAQRTWVGLTDEERKRVRNTVGYNQLVTAGEYAEHVQKATEAKLEEKNT